MLQWHCEPSAGRRIARRSSPPFSQLDASQNSNLPPWANYPMRSHVGVGHMRSSAVAKRTIYLGGGRKRSVALEGAFWEGLNEIAHRRQMTVSKLVSKINARRRQNNLSSTLRLFVLQFYRSQIPDPPDLEGVCPPAAKGGGGGE